MQNTYPINESIFCPCTPKVLQKKVTSLAGDTHGKKFFPEGSKRKICKDTCFLADGFPSEGHEEYYLSYTNEENCLILYVHS